MSNVVRVLFFATFKQLVGQKEILIDLPDGATVKDVKVKLTEQYPGLTIGMNTSIVSINHHFAFDHEVVPRDAEIAVFPPVSGGSGEQFPTICKVVEEEIDLNKIISDVTLPSTGAIVTFTGIVRAITPDSKIKTTEHLEYEAYQPMAIVKMKQLTDEIRSKWADVEGIAIVQRIGFLAQGVPTVVIACSASHRGSGVFEAARYGIDRLKEIVPIWKKEVSSSGEEWIEGTYIPKVGE